MAECECLAGCPFFNDKMLNMPATADLMKKQYCKGIFSECARYRVFKKLGKASVPPDLFPSQAERAQALGA